MYPELNVDREGSGTREEMQRYDHYRDELIKIANEVDTKYKLYRKAVKQRLYL